MPPKKKGPKCESSGFYKPKQKSKKRKNLSPIQVVSECSNKSDNRVNKGGNQVDNQVDNRTDKGDNKTGQQKTSVISPEIYQQPKRFHQSSPSFFDFGPYYTSGANNMSMNFQQMPFGGQYMQSPPFGSQIPTPGPNAPPQPSPQPPQWAIEIMEDIKTIKSSMSKIDSIEKFVNKINLKVENLETKVKTIDSKVTETEKSSAFLNSEVESTKKKLKNAEEEMKKMSDKCKNFEKLCETMETKTLNLEAKTNDLEARGLRENLLFHGIPETTGENCETLVKDFINEKLLIMQNITLDRAHRLGKPRTGKTRPIVCKFHYYSERELVRITAQTKTDELKHIHQGVGIQQTKSVLQKRRDLSAVYDREKAAGRTVKWAGSRLMVRDGNEGDFHEVTE